MFGKKKKEPKKSVTETTVMLQNGIPNFKNDSVIKVIVDEPNGCLMFKEAKKESFEPATASLSFDKIKSTEIGQRDNTIADSSTVGALVGGLIGGTAGAVIGSTTGKKAAAIPALRIRYESGGEEKEINLYQCNFHSEGTINLIKLKIDVNIETESKERHMDL